MSQNFNTLSYLILKTNQEQYSILLRVFLVLYNYEGFKLDWSELAPFSSDDEHSIFELVRLSATRLFHC